MALKVLFYGTRGQIMSVSRDRLIYGGHTSCLTVHHNNNHLILDAGFGIATLGDQLMQNYDIVKGSHDFHILLSHFHWDHIQGLQYFNPIYFKGNRIHVYSPFEVDVVKDVMNLLFDDSYTPFNGLDSMPCEWIFHNMNDNLEIGSFTVSHQHTVHVGECYAYKIITNDGTVVFSADHDANPSNGNDEFVEWAKGCDMLIHEAMFTPSEHRNHLSLGHSSFISAMDNAEKIEAETTLLTHHAPLRSDSDLSEHERYLKKLYNSSGKKLAFAREGIDYIVKKKS